MAGSHETVIPDVAAAMAVATMAMARGNLQRKRQELVHMPDYKRYVSSSYVPVREVLAVCLWLEQLGPAFGMPLEGHVFQCVLNVKQFLTAILRKANAGRVQETLMKAHDFVNNLTDLDLVDFKRLEVLREGRWTSGDLPHKLTLWKTIASKGCNSEPLVDQLTMWHQAWSQDDWSSNKFTRMHACYALEMCSEVMRMAADILNCGLDYESNWLEVEVKSLFNRPAFSGQRETREGLGEDEQDVEELVQRKIGTERVILDAAAREEAKACLICSERSRNVVIFPCSHGHYCEECLETHRKTSSTCPLCQ